MKMGKNMGPPGSFSIIVHVMANTTGTARKMMKEMAAATRCESKNVTMLEVFILDSPNGYAVCIQRDNLPVSGAI